MYENGDERANGNARTRSGRDEAPGTRDAGTLDADGRATRSPALDAPRAAGASPKAREEFWVFGYGSLLWKQGFPYAEEARARLEGYTRSLCIHSHRHRGTPERPGLVLGLQPGGSCDGMAYRVEEAHREETIRYLRERELVTNVYLERVLPVRLVDEGREVRCLAFVVDATHPQYAGDMGVDEAVERVRGARGDGGPNEEYVVNTVKRLNETGIRDERLEAIAARL